MRRLTAKLAALASTALLATTLTGLTLATPAQAAPPVTVDDTVTMYENSFALPDLLANDSDADGDSLAVCRVKEVVDGPVMFMQFLGEPFLFTSAGSAGTYTFTYYTCDWETLVPGTLTVEVKPSPKLKISVSKLPKRPGRLKVVNKSNFPISFAWGSALEVNPDKEIRIGKKKTEIVKVRRTAVAWQAYNIGNGAMKMGFIKGIKLAKNTKPLPPSPRPRGARPSVLEALTAPSTPATWLTPQVSALRTN